MSKHTSEVTLFFYFIRIQLELERLRRRFHEENEARAQAEERVLEVSANKFLVVHFICLAPKYFFR